MSPCSVLVRRRCAGRRWHPSSHFVLRQRDDLQQLPLSGLPGYSAKGGSSYCPMQLCAEHDHSRSALRQRHICSGMKKVVQPSRAPAILRDPSRSDRDRTPTPQGRRIEGQRNRNIGRMSVTCSIMVHCDAEMPNSSHARSNWDLSSALRPSDPPSACQLSRAQRSYDQPRVALLS